MYKKKTLYYDTIKISICRDNFQTEKRKTYFFTKEQYAQDKKKKQISQSVKPILSEIRRSTYILFHDLEF